MIIFSDIFSLCLIFICVTLFLNKSNSLKCSSNKPFLFIPKFYLSDKKYYGDEFCSNYICSKYRKHFKSNLSIFNSVEDYTSNLNPVFSFDSFHEYLSEPTHSNHEAYINEDSNGFLLESKLSGYNNNRNQITSTNEICSLCSYDESPHLLDQIQSRLNNYEDLTNKFGVNPYPEISSIDVYDTFAKVISENENLGNGEEVERYYTIFGRVEGIRFDGHFMDLVNINREFKNYLEADLLIKRLHKNNKLQIMFRSEEPILLDTGVKISISGNSNQITNNNTNMENNNNSSHLPSYLCKELIRLVDIGDVLELYGNVKKTKLGEISLVPKKIKFLSKCLIPLPSKQHGLKDVETRFRLRHLDLLSNEESRFLILKRFQIIAKIRQFLNDRGFVEIDTPILQHYTSGDLAEPFETYYKRFQQNVKLRIAPEFSLKRLLMSLNLTKVYEIGKCFRNEGTSLTHSPEFTMIEIYQKMTDYNYMIELFEKLINHLLSYTVKLSGTNQDDANGKCQDNKENNENIIKDDNLINVNNNKHNNSSSNTELLKCTFEIKWVRKRFQDLIKEYTGIDITMYNKDELINKLNEMLFEKQNNQYNDNTNDKSNMENKNNNEHNDNINEYNKENNNNTKMKILLNSWGEVANEIFEKFVVPNLKYPVHVTHLPKQISPLCYYDNNNNSNSNDYNQVDIANKNNGNTTIYNKDCSRLFSNRFESYLGGMEVANGCTEQCNPLILSKLLVNKDKNNNNNYEENKNNNNEHNDNINEYNKDKHNNNKYEDNKNNDNIKQENEDNKEVDKEFLHSVFCGTEPMAGLGIGIDRLIMYLTKTKNIKEIQPLPSLRKV